jgi:hypothetical protein
VLRRPPYRASTCWPKPERGRQLSRRPRLRRIYLGDALSSSPFASSPGYFAKTNCGLRIPNKYGDPLLVSCPRAVVMLRQPRRTTPVAVVRPGAEVGSASGRFALRVLPRRAFFMPRGSRPEPSDVIEVYIDESSQTGHQFLVLGGIGVEALEILKLNELLQLARSPELPKGEPKWTKVSRSKLPAYKRLVDVMFDNKNLAHFHSLVINTSKLDHRRFNKGDHDIGFNKEIYQLAMKFGKLYSTKLLHVYPDRRNTSQKTDDLRLILNRGCRKNGDKRDWPFRRCQFRDSSTTPALQLVDLLIGAIAYELNGHGRAPNASPSKMELSRHVLERAQVRDAMCSTARTGRFTIWHRQLKGVPQP